MESLSELVPYLPYAGGWVIPALVGVASLIGGVINQRRQHKANKDLAAFQADANERYLDKQNAYNTPKNQMTRFQDAGLNPNLIYGQGSPGNQSTPLQYPEIGRTNYQDMGNVMGTVNQTAMTMSQVQAIDAKTRQTYVLTELNKLQAQVMAKNPLLDNAGYKSIIQGLISTAEIKAAESTMKTGTADWFSGEKSFNVGGKPMHGPAGVLKLESELKLLEQRFNLGSLDAKLKAEVLTSKEFQNAILEVQKRWMTDAEITPQHILQFIQLLLMKSL